MKPFIHDDFLLQCDAARELYHRHAKTEPIFDYHCHVSPQQIAEAVSAGELDLLGLEQAEDAAIHARVIEECQARLGEISGRFEQRAAMRA